MFLLEVIIFLAAIAYGIINLVTTITTPLEKMNEKFMRPDDDFYVKLLFGLMFLPSWLLKGFRKLITTIIA